MAGVIVAALAAVWLLAVHFRYHLEPAGGGYPVVYKLDRWTGKTIMVAGSCEGAVFSTRP